MNPSLQCCIGKFHAETVDTRHPARTSSARGNRWITKAPESHSVYKFRTLAGPAILSFAVQTISPHVPRKLRHDELAAYLGYINHWSNGRSFSSFPLGLARSNVLAERSVCLRPSCTAPCLISSRATQPLTASDFQAKRLARICLVQLPMSAWSVSAGSFPLGPPLRSSVRPRFAAPCSGHCADCNIRRLCGGLYLC